MEMAAGGLDLGRRGADHLFRPRLRARGRPTAQAPLATRGPPRAHGRPGTSRSDCGTGHRRLNADRWVRLRLAVGQPTSRGMISMFSRIVRCGKRPMPWKT